MTNRTNRIFVRLAFVVVVAALSGASAASAQDYDALKAQAESFYEEGSYARALELYRQAAELDLSGREARWVNYRIGDTMWRAHAATRQTDDTIFERAREKLEQLIDGYDLATGRDDIWAFAQESLGDFWWQRRSVSSWSQAWPRYSSALDYWAGSRDLEQARERYLGIVFGAAHPEWMGRHVMYNYAGNLPINVLENAREVAKRDGDVAQATYLLAQALRNQGDWPQQRRVAELFQDVIALGRDVEWYDDALYQLAEWLSQQGRPVRNDSGGWTRERDYVRALELYRRIVNEFRSGETRYRDNARNRIHQITATELRVTVSNAFLPESAMQFHLRWRNLQTVEFELHRVELTEHVDFPARTEQGKNWLEVIDLAAAEKVRSWTKELEAEPYEPHDETITLDEPLPLGAYVVVANAGGNSSRDLLLVTDATLVMKDRAEEVLLWFVDSIDGSPIADAEVSVWEIRRDGRSFISVEHRAHTDEDGVAQVELARSHVHGMIFAAAAKGDRQAFAQDSTYAYGSGGRQHRIYAFTDRPAYRPEDTVKWKAIVREYDDSTYSTPANMTVEYQITDPRGTKLTEGELELNEFGSAWGEIDLSEDIPLGEYNIQFWTEGRSEMIGGAMLFRLEEYKLPEYEVTVSTPLDEQGRRKTYQLGDVVEVEIKAEYYFGGPVTDADVEVVVHQRPYWHSWSPPHEYPWLHDDSAGRRWWYGRGGGQEVKREQLTTNAEGVATLTLETPYSADQNLEYEIEARVVDASRREVIATETVAVTRQKYFVYPRTEHNIYRPGEPVETTFKAIDANDQPVQTEGLVEVFRDVWREVWVAPDGREVSGTELAAERRRHQFFPPHTPPDKPAWRLRHRGYESEKILSQTVKTDDQGDGVLTFTPKKDGYYRITWLSEKRDDYPVTAQTYVWVCTDASRAIGYHHGGVDIVVDRDTFKVGQAAPVMISVPTNDRYVLFTIEGNELFDARVVHVEGTVKLVHVEVKDAYIPNVWLSGTFVNENQQFQDAEEVIVPPTDHFLEVDVAADREAYQPGESGSLTVTTTDTEGNPVSAEVALSLIDESVYYIQQEYAGDPRQFFFGDRQHQQVSTSSTFGQKRYVKLVEGPEGQLIDEDELARRAEARSDRMRDQYARAEMQTGATAGQRRAGRAVRGGGGFGGGGGGFGGGLAARDADFMKSTAPPAPPARSPALAEPGTDGQEPAVRVRTDFRATAFWSPSVVTDENGRATVEFVMPDSTTRWNAVARAATAGSAFGMGEATTRTRKPLIVRLQAPRFFVVNDEVVITAVANNQTDEPMTVNVDASIEGLDLLGDAGTRKTVTIPANGSEAVDWRVAVREPGEAKITITGRSERHADGMEKSYTIHEHGIEKHLVKAGKVSADEVTITLDIPAERGDGSTDLTVQVTPSMAVTMLDALPYLIDYPYGCTEQTMSRFLPTAIVAKTLEDLGLDAETAMSGVFGGIEPAHAEATHPRGRKSLQEIDDMIRRGLDRLADFQHSDGGWGWWKEGPSDRYMSAYVVWGLAVAVDAGIEVDRDVLSQGVEYLRTNLVEAERAYDLQAWMLHALAAYQHAQQGDNARTEFEITAIANLWENRDRLNAYTRALFALAAHYYGDSEKAETLVRNLENGVKTDETPDTSVIVRGEQRSHPAVIPTAHWGADGVYYRWSQGGVESTAFALRALLAIDPDHELITPVMNWLVKNRRGAQWDSTKSTAITVLTLNEYLRTSGELTPDLEYELFVNGRSIATRSISPDDLFDGPSRFVIDPEVVRDGANDVRIVRRGGKGPIYFAVDAEFFSREEPITPAGNEIFVRRGYYKLVPHPTLLKGYEYERVPMADGDRIESGERAEVVITIEAKNDYEYLVFEDLKPAGLEAVSIQSGTPVYAKELNLAGIERRFDEGEQIRPIDVERDPADYTGRTTWIYQELRDRHVAMFFNRLPEGVWEIRYQYRAEVPGEFHALPVLGYAMYVPEIRCNSREMRMTVYEAE